MYIFVIKHKTKSCYSLAPPTSILPSPHLAEINRSENIHVFTEEYRCSSNVQQHAFTGTTSYPACSAYTHKHTCSGVQVHAAGTEIAWQKSSVLTGRWFKEEPNHKHQTSTLSQKIQPPDLQFCSGGQTVTEGQTKKMKTCRETCS